jgi:ATP-dependent Lon protease
MTLAAYEKTLPLLPLRTGLVLPGRTLSIPVGRVRSRALVEAVEPGHFVVLAAQKDPTLDDPTVADLHPMAVLAVVKDKAERGRRGMLILVEAVQRREIEDVVTSDPYWLVKTRPVVETNEETAEALALRDALAEHLRELAPSDSGVRAVLESEDLPGLFADRVTTWIDGSPEEKMGVLEALDVQERLRLTVRMLKAAKSRAELRSRIDTEVRGEFTKEQREVMLRKQLRAIQRELGEGHEDEVDVLREKLENLELDAEARRFVDREVSRLSGMSSQMAEANVIRTHLETIADLPWNVRAEAHQDIDAVSAALDEDHHGLSEAKQRILEHMAVLKLSPEARGTILCLVGPPGVGKTSLAQSVARATGRPLQRVSLGGVRDEAEIRGHRRTYVGALPGRIVTALRKAGVKNPVMVLDEIDKLAKGFSGDPEAALLEVLDPEQNVEFTDHYIELPFDLSEVLFIATANDLATITPPLRDRMEIIEVTGYTTEEKRLIARDHLLPKQMRRHGLTDDQLKISDEALVATIGEYTREAGVRKLEQQLAKLCRHAALEVARRAAPESEIHVLITIDDLRHVLGRARFAESVAERVAAPGVAAGLAWTPVGGDILYIETTRMKGKGRLEITGQLGDVMSESVRAALAYVRSNADDLGIDASFLEASDLHLHVPAGAVPKDGPSAGVTIFTALTSLLSGRRVRSDTAMTGEATLRGRVLPVGGIKSKVLAAHRAGFSRVILPKQNEPDLDEIPASVRDALEFVLVEDMREVLDAALEPAESPAAPLHPEETSPQRAA